MRLLPTKKFIEQLFDKKIDMMKDCNGERYVTGCSLSLEVKGGEFIEATIKNENGDVMFRSELSEKHFNHVNFPEVAIRLHSEGIAN